MIDYPLEEKKTCLLGPDNWYGCYEVYQGLPENFNLYKPEMLKRCFEKMAEHCIDMKNFDNAYEIQFDSLTVVIKDFSHLKDDPLQPEIKITVGLKWHMEKCR